LGKNVRKPQGDTFFDSHCTYSTTITTAAAAAAAIPGLSVSHSWIIRKLEGTWYGRSCLQVKFLRKLYDAFQFPQYQCVACGSTAA